MGILIRVKEDLAALIEKRSRYYFGRKEEERSNRAALLHQTGMYVRSCPTQHKDVAWSGPPHDAIEAWVCLHCKAAACAPEMKDRGYDFWECPDYVIDEILDLDLQRQAQGNIVSYPILGR